MSHLLTIKEAAKYLGISERQMYKLLEAGAVPRIRLATQTVRISPHDLEAFIECAKTA